MLNGTAVFAAMALMCINSAYNLLVTLSKTDGAYTYSPRSVVLLAEILKCIISAFSLWLVRGKRENGDTNAQRVTPRLFCSYAIPGFLYFFNNNVPFYCLLYMDVASFQVLLQLKIATTAIACRLMLGKILPLYKWVALGLLLFGSILTQLEYGFALRSTSLGYVLVSIQVSISAVASVATEKLLKEVKQSLHLQNLQLYSWGVLFGVLSLYVDRVSTSGFLHGHGICSSLAVICLALTGLATSAVMKHADNLVKIFALTGAMLFVAFASYFLFGTRITPQFICGALVCGSGCYLYFSDKAPGWLEGLATANGDSATAGSLVSNQANTNSSSKATSENS